MPFGLLCTIAHFRFPNVWSRAEGIADHYQPRASLFHFLSLSFWAIFFGYIWRPSTPTRALKVSMWFWVTRCTLFNDYSAKTDLIFIYDSCFGLLGIWKSSFWAMLCSITPLLRVQVPPRSPYGLKPLISCIASPANQRTDLFCEFGSFFFSFSPFSNFLGHVFFGYFWPPSMLICAV